MTKSIIKEKKGDTIMQKRFNLRLFSDLLLVLLLGSIVYAANGITHNTAFWAWTLDEGSTTAQGKKKWTAPVSLTSSSSDYYPAIQIKSKGTTNGAASTCYNVNCGVGNSGYIQADTGYHYVGVTGSIVAGQKYTAFHTQAYSWNAEIHGLTYVLLVY